MTALDPRIDAYIAKSADFARPILTHLRTLVHAACPEVQETLKWGMPHFMYKDAILCGMAGFKEHCTFGFWLGRVLFPEMEKESMGNYGRIGSIKDLPPKQELRATIKRAMQLADDGVKAPARPKAAPAALDVPVYFARALKGSKAANTVFDAGSPSFRKEYVAWLEEAKTEATRDRRMAQAIEWLAEGKSRNWKYEKC